MRSRERGSVTSSIVIIVAAVVGLSASIVACEKCQKIQPGFVGVSVKKCSGGGVSPDPIPTGYYWRELWCEDVVEYPISMQSLILTKDPKEGAKSDESITVTSSEGLGISVDVALNFTLDAKKVPQIYEKWRADITDIAHKYIRQTIREGLQDTFAKYTAEELYSDKKETARAEVEKFLRDRLTPYGFMISQFTINRIEPPAQVIQAINAKVAMVQQAQQSEQEVKKKEAEAAQKVAIAKGDADAMQTEAQGEAQAITVKAEAQAKANKLLSESLTPQLVEYEKALKWNGQLPTMTGGVTPMVSFKQ